MCITNGSNWSGVGINSARKLHAKNTHTDCVHRKWSNQNGHYPLSSEKYKYQLSVCGACANDKRTANSIWTYRTWMTQTKARTTQKWQNNLTGFCRFPCGNRQMRCETKPTCHNYAMDRPKWALARSSLAWDLCNAQGERKRTETSFFDIEGKGW